ncbi:hypothetical protein HPB51_022518 [Rhipicephalus microplus]|uniref:Uncharacterized protein n=1 Tax=Rhipicephalus microplus TaxID=6941 RepID=A0A9J6ECD3_RHIMP|nr:hypothetical protein HPB51_022518 [Rhipicephalus microplus]
MTTGFIVRAASKRIAGAECIAMLQAPNRRAPNHGLIKHLDRGGLYYPTQELVKVIGGLRRYVDCVLSQQRSVKKPFDVCVERSIQELVSLPVLSCSITNSDHRKVLLKVITQNFIKPLFANYAQGKTDMNNTEKFFQRKPLSRKILKL